MFLIGNSHNGASGGPVLSSHPDDIHHEPFPGKRGKGIEDYRERDISISRGSVPDCGWNQFHLDKSSPL